MRLQPIEEPKGLAMRFAFWGTRRQFGKVMTPMKVLYPRVPEMLRLSYEIQKFETKGIRLDHGLHYLVVALTSKINGCDFCMDLARSMILREQLDTEKLDSLTDYRTHPKFTERERAALSYVEEATRSKRVSVDTFTTLQRFFTEREIVEITWLNAIENYYNLINLSLGIGSDGFCAIAQSRKA